MFKILLKTIDYIYHTRPIIPLQKDTLLLHTVTGNCLQKQRFALFFKNLVFYPTSSLYPSAVSRLSRSPAFATLTLTIQPSP